MTVFDALNLAKLTSHKIISINVLPKLETLLANLFVNIEKDS